jgi:hypothetical protein
MFGVLDAIVKRRLGNDWYDDPEDTVGCTGVPDDDAEIEVYWSWNMIFQLIPSLCARRLYQCVYYVVNLSQTTTRM